MALVGLARRVQDQVLKQRSHMHPGTFIQGYDLMLQWVKVTVVMEAA